MASLSDTSSAGDGVRGTPLLEVSDLSKRFAGVAALDHVTFTLRRGEIHALCGENGAGKSTLIKCLSGVWPYGSYDGVIRIDGREARFQQVADSQREGIGVIYQELALVREMTVAENIFLGSEPRRFGLVDWNTVYQRTAEILERFGLDLDPAATVSDLGIGQQQLVEIVKALAKDSRLLLLDEPTAALTETEVDILMRILNELRSKGLTCIYISHKLDEIMRVADTITVLRDGRSVRTTPTRETTREQIIQSMVGREIREQYPKVTASPGATLLKTEGLTVRSAEEDTIILNNISLQLCAGEVVGIGGLMGAGRTELLLHLFAGVGERVAGTVTLNGTPLAGNRPPDSIARGLMMVTEDRKRYGLVMDQSIGFNLSLASLRRFVWHGVLLDADREIVRNRELFGVLGVKASGQEDPVRGLSGGNQQKVVLGKALMTEPTVVLLDEPTRGIDVGAKLEVYELMNRLTAAGKAVLLVSSELPELMHMSDRMIILSQGRIGGEFTREGATPEAVLEAAMVFS